MTDQTPTPSTGPSPGPPSPSAETVDGQRVIQGTVIPATVAVSVQPTQVRRPWRSTVRTMFQALLALALVWPVVVTAMGLPDWAWVGVSVAIAGGIARVMALPGVEAFLRQFLPFLSAAPKPNQE